MNDRYTVCPVGRNRKKQDSVWTDINCFIPDAVPPADVRLPEWV